MIASGRPGRVALVTTLIPERRMTRLRRLAAAAALASATSGCLSPPMTDAPIPTVDNSPNPAPVRGYRVRCETVPDLFYPVNGVFSTGCQQILPASGGRVVVRAKG